MNGANLHAGPSSEGPAYSGIRRFLITALKYLALMVVDALGLVIIYAFLADDNMGLAVVIAIITFGANLIFFVPRLYPIRWMTPGLMLITLMVIYPVIYTVATAFTNHSDGHLFTKQQTIDLIRDRGYVPEYATTYSWVPFRRGEDEYALWLTDDEGQVLFALPDAPLQEVDVQQIRQADLTEDAPPDITGYERLTDTSQLTELEMLEYPDPVGHVHLRSLNLDVRYIYDIDQGLTLDRERGDTYETTVFINEEDFLAFWLIESVKTEEALLVLPGEDLEEIELEDDEALSEYDIDLAEGVTIPDRIGNFVQVGDPLVYEQDLRSLVMTGVDDGFRGGTFDLDNRFVLDVEEAIALDQQKGDEYETSIYVSEDSERYALWMDGGRSGSYLARNDAPVLYNGVPVRYEGYRQMISNLERTESLRFFELVDFEYFGTGDDTVGIINTRTAGRPYIRRFEYDAEADAFTDLATNKVYQADDETGAFMASDGDKLLPGYRVGVGLLNFERLLQDPGLRGPLIAIFAWTVAFSVLSVLMTFAMGLFMAIIMEDPLIPGRRIIRSLLIIPYAIPGVISILVWQGMLNQNIGIITRTIAEWTGVTIPWFSDPVLAKIAILLVNLWLGYPYMMLVCSGALQAIPSDVYEAAAVDGAKAWQRFKSITLPLLLVTVGPLLIASFAFNFNNFLIIEALTEGDPPMSGTPTPAGHTDILISYTYRLAFGSDRGADYGYASAITIVIFAIVAFVTMIQFRFTRAWEEVGENV